MVTQTIPVKESGKHSLIVSDETTRNQMTKNNPAKSLTLKQKARIIRNEKLGGDQMVAGSTQVLNQIQLEVENTKLPAPSKLFLRNTT